MKHLLLIDSLSKQVMFYFQLSPDFLTGLAAKAGGIAHTRKNMNTLSFKNSKEVITTYLP